MLIILSVLLQTSFICPAGSGNSADGLPATVNVDASGERIDPHHQSG